jgi:hypothetical protein
MSSGYCGLGIIGDRIERCQMIKRAIVSLVMGVSMLFASAANADTITCYQQGNVQVCYRTPTVVVAPVIVQGYYGYYGHGFYGGRGYYGYRGGYGVRGYGGFHGGWHGGGGHGRR